MNPQSLLANLVSIWLFVPALLAQDRTYVTNDRLTLGTESNRSASVRLADVDGDRDLDVVVANGRHWPQQNYLILNQGAARCSVMRLPGCW